MNGIQFSGGKVKSNWHISLIWYAGS